MKEKKKMSLAMQIFIALVLAIIAGLLMQNYADFATNYIKPFGTIFLNLIKFIVCPIVLFSIMCGIISMSDIKKVGSIGLKTVVFYLCTTAFAVTCSRECSRWLQPRICPMRLQRQPPLWIRW